MEVFIICIILIIAFVIFIYNRFVKLKNTASQSKSGIDVYLQQRFDLIPNLIEITKGYANHEITVLESIASLRSKFSATKDENAKNELSKTFTSLLGIVESYPDLKASEQFLKLQKALTKIESELQAARRIYNNDVTTYNTMLHSFPFNLFAKLFGFKEMELFSLEGEENIKINL